MQYLQFPTHFLLSINMSNRSASASAVDDELVKALDPTQDAQVVQWDNVTAHIKGHQITFVTGSATLVPRDDEYTRDGFDEPIASSAEVVSTSSPSDCLAPMKEQPPRTPVQSPKKCGGFSELRRSDSLVDPRNPYLQGCGGKLDFGSDDKAESTPAPSASAAPSESLLGKRSLGGNSSDDITKRSRTMEELEKDLREANRYAAHMADRYLKCLHDDYKRACYNDEMARRRRRVEDVTNRLLFSAIENFPSPERADWLAENLADLRVWADEVNWEDDLRALLQEDGIDIDPANADANADADADADAAANNEDN